LDEIPSGSNVYNSGCLELRPYRGRLFVEKQQYSVIATPAGSNVYRKIMVFYTTTPSGSNVYKKRNMSRTTTPSGSNVCGKKNMSGITTPSGLTVCRKKNMSGITTPSGSNVYSSGGRKQRPHRGHMFMIKRICVEQRPHRGRMFFHPNKNIFV